MQAKLLVDCRCTLGEGIQWNAELQRLYWSDINGARLWSCDADGGAVETRDLPDRLGSFAFDPDGNILAAFTKGLYRMTADLSRIDRLTEFEPGHPTSRLNDGRCDRQGRFLAGGVDENRAGRIPGTSTLIRYADGQQETILGGIGCSNSICFSPDGRWMYFADTATRIIRRFAYDPETGAMSDEQAFHETPEGAGSPDGSCISADGSLWNACFGGSRVQQIHADGTEGLRIDVPVRDVTCACFGGPDLTRLYITTARHKMSKEEVAARPTSGSIFVVEPGAVGLPEDRYAHRLFA